MVNNMVEITLTKIDDDDWGRKRFVDVEAKRVLAVVDGFLHTVSLCGEPDCPLRDDVNVCYVEPEHFTKEIRQAVSCENRNMHKLCG